MCTTAETFRTNNQIVNFGLWGRLQFLSQLVQSEHTCCVLSNAVEGNFKENPGSLDQIQCASNSHRKLQEQMLGKVKWWCK